MTRKEARKILGVGIFATADEIKKAHRAVSLKTHPDRGGTEDGQKQVNLAAEVLMSNEQEFFGVSAKSIREALELAEEIQEAKGRTTGAVRVIEIAQGTLRSPLVEQVKNLLRKNTT